MTDELVDAAFRRASAALDEAWQLVRELQIAARSYRVDTLSDSLADPLEHSVEALLASASTLIRSESDRIALTAVARAAQVQGLMTEAAWLRIVKEYEP